MVQPYRVDLRRRKTQNQTEPTGRAALTFGTFNFDGIFLFSSYTISWDGTRARWKWRLSIAAVLHGQLFVRLYILHRRRTFDASSGIIRVSESLERHNCEVLSSALCMTTLATCIRYSSLEALVTYDILVINLVKMKLLFYFDCGFPSCCTFVGLICDLECLVYFVTMTPWKETSGRK